LFIDPEGPDGILPLVNTGAYEAGVGYLYLPVILK